jgi:hypothetical protein
MKPHHVSVLDVAEKMHQVQLGLFLVLRQESEHDGV